MSKAVFLDRDGTINIDGNYIYKQEAFEFVPGAVEGLRMLQKAGYELIIITNQSGIARGYYTEENFRHLNDWMLEELKKLGVVIRKVYYCPHHPEGKLKKYKKLCTCRKPGLKLYEEAIKDYNIDLAESFAIGDKIRDLAICESTECRGYLVGDNEEQECIDRIKAGDMNNVRYRGDLLECAKDIVGIERSSVQ